MTTLIIPPDSSSYAAARGDEVLSVKLDGGASKFRLDILNAAFLVDATWILDRDGYEYINAFYRTATGHGSLPFSVELILDTPLPVLYAECHFVPGSLKLSAQSGFSYTVSAQIEVTPPINNTEEADDAAIIAAYEAAHP